MMTSFDIRKAFLEFFTAKGHTIVPSAPLVVKNDPTLMFTNAGMNQFKDYFLGNKKAPYSRVADTQKCLRVSGKHNDLEEVGVDTYHHTMFEMLGNWSFGDYFKNEAIEWSWQLLTEVYKIPQERLYATVFEGDAKENIPPSAVALSKWRTLLPEEHIVFGNKKDNFWEMGDTGPCGPCSEIHIDCRSAEERKKIPGHTLVNKDHPQVIEIWNNVFIQFNRKKDGSLEPLPSTHVDTGMGLERLVRVLQGKNSNYDTDIFQGTIAATGSICGLRYDGTDTKVAVAFRVIADHIRAIAFTIADGQLPSNTGAGYVIRRILRRAVRYYYSYLQYRQPLLAQLVPQLALQFKDVFPELYQQSEFVGRVIREEEEAFLRTLDKGLRRIDDMVRVAQGGVIPGAAAFELYDTYGFPIDLTRLIATEQGLQVDEAGFDAEMKQQKDRSRAATAIDAGDWVVLCEGSNQFIGYEQLEATAQVLKYRKVTAKGKEGYQWVLSVTPFYAESGGQVGDRGTLQFGEQTLAVVDTKKDNDLIVHYTLEKPAVITDSVQASVDGSLRLRTAVHHTATHLLHAALRMVLGTHVAQKGSLVADTHLRFDFSHFAKVSNEELLQIETIVNTKIRENIPVVIKTLPKDEALQLGAMALFGEKYGDKVRVVITDPSYSIELCGGTHVGHTGELGLFSLVGETAVAAGVRRVEGVCGQPALDQLRATTQVFNSVREQLKHPKDLLKAIEQLQQEQAQLRQQLEHYEQKEIRALCDTLSQKIQQVGEVQFIGSVIEVAQSDSLKKCCLELRGIHRHSVIVLAAVCEGKSMVAISVADELTKTKSLDANVIVKTVVAPLIKGGGGGQKTLATAGGQDITRLSEVIQAVMSLL